MGSSPSTPIDIDTFKALKEEYDSGVEAGKSDKDIFDSLNVVCVYNNRNSMF